MDTTPDTDALFEDVDIPTIVDNLADAQAAIWEIAEKLNVEAESLDEAVAKIEEVLENADL